MLIKRENLTPARNLWASKKSYGSDIVRKMYRKTHCCQYCAKPMHYRKLMQCAGCRSGESMTPLRLAFCRNTFSVSSFLLCYCILLLLSILILMCLVVPSRRSKQDIAGRNVRKLPGPNLKNCSLPRIPICLLTTQAKAHTISYTFQMKPSHGQNKTRNRPICIPQMYLTPKAPPWEGVYEPHLIMESAGPTYVPHPKCPSPRMSLIPNVPHPECPSPRMSLTPNVPHPKCPSPQMSLIPKKSVT